MRRRPREQLERLRMQRVMEAAGAVRTDCRSSGWGRVGCSLRRWLLEWRVPEAAGSTRDRGHSISPGRSGRRSGLNRQRRQRLRKLRVRE